MSRYKVTIVGYVDVDAEYVKPMQNDLFSVVTQEMGLEELSVVMEEEKDA